MLNLVFYDEIYSSKFDVTYIQKVLINFKLKLFEY